MRLFIAEKPSVAKAIAAELGIVGRSDGAIQCQGDNLVTWCFGICWSRPNRMPTRLMTYRAARMAKNSGVWMNCQKITAHHGIIPTRHVGNKSALSEQEKNLYELIVRAYIAQFWPPHDYLQTRVALEVCGETFTASGKTVIKNGWKDVYSQADEEQDSPAKGKGASEDEGSSGQTLPAMRQSDSIRCTEAQRLDASSKPPARFTEGTLIRAMENIYRVVDDPEHKKRLRDGDGIGTSATRASIIAELKRRTFLQSQGKQVISTELGRALVDALPEAVKSPVLTALYERLLKAIEQGEKPLDDFVKRQEQSPKAWRQQQSLQTPWRGRGCAFTGGLVAANPRRNAMNSNENHEAHRDEEPLNPDRHAEHPTDEQLTDEERRIVEQLRLERENYDEQADLRERVEAKMQLLAEFPGIEVELDPDEAEVMGLFEETAMSVEDAWEARFDDVAP